MLRCGQMVLAEAMLRSHRHTGGDIMAWRTHVITLFADVPECPFSIHQIALRGSIVDKAVGAWFGPNGAAQVIK
jgi:hypothetical protein